MPFLKLFWIFFGSSFILFLPSPELIAAFHTMFDSFTFLLCIYYITDFWLVITMRFIYCNLYLYLYSIYQSLSLFVCDYFVMLISQLQSMLITLYFYHSLPIDCVWYHILHVLFCESLNYLLWTEMILFLLPFNPFHLAFIHDWLTTFTEYLLYQWYFSFHNFHFFCSDLFSPT